MKKHIFVFDQPLFSEAYERWINGPEYDSPSICKTG